MTLNKKTGREDVKLPKDLDLKLGTEDERNWTQVRDSARANIKQSEFNIKLQEAVLEISNKKILAERIKFKQKQNI